MDNLIQTETGTEITYLHLLKMFESDHDNKDKKDARCFFGGLKTNRKLQTRNSFLVCMLLCHVCGYVAS